MKADSSRSASLSLHLLSTKANCPHGVVIQEIYTSIFNVILNLYSLFILRNYRAMCR